MSDQTLASSSPLSSLAELWRSLPTTRREALLATLSNREIEAIVRDWSIWARPEQLPPPGDWNTWLILSGRGFGKTRASSEWVHSQVAHGRRRIALVARSAADVRDVVIEGESGILATAPSWNAPTYEPSKRRLTWPSGAIATAYSADEPDLLRGPQHDAAACDELASWRYAQECWDNLMLSLRLGDRPQCIVTTTPRPIKIIRDLMRSPTTVVTRGSTFDNALNLATSALAEYRSRYEGTRLGRQELMGELIEDVPGALWQRDDLDRLRVRQAPELIRVVVAIDPAVTAKEGSDETGILVAGKGADGHFYVLADRSGRFTPEGWARRAVGAFDEFKADRIVIERNQGGDMCERVLRGVRENIALSTVHASRGKQTRAEPIAALYEQGKVHHVGGFPELEDQMCAFAPDGRDAGHDDRVDAAVWALTELSATQPGMGVMQWMRDQAAKHGVKAPTESAAAETSTRTIYYDRWLAKARRPGEIDGLRTTTAAAVEEEQTDDGHMHGDSL